MVVAMPAATAWEEAAAGRPLPAWSGRRSALLPAGAGTARRRRVASWGGSPTGRLAPSWGRAATYVARSPSSRAAVSAGDAAWALAAASALHGTQDLGHP